MSYYIIIYYNKAEDKKKVMLFSGYPEDVELLVYGYDRVIIPLDKKQYTALLNMPGKIDL